MSGYTLIWDARRWVRSDSTDVTNVLPILAGGTGNTTGTATVNANLTGPITSTGNATAVASQTGTGSTFVMAAGSPTFTGTPALGAPTATTIQTSGNVGIGTTPSATTGILLNMLSVGNFTARVEVANTDATDAGSASVIRSRADTALARLVAYGTGNNATGFGVTLGGYSSSDNGGAGNGLLVGTTNSAPMILGTNNTAAVTIDTSQTATFAANAKLGTVGGGIYVKEGTNATMGVTTLVLGTKTISTTKVTANSRIFLAVESIGTVTVPTVVGVTARTPGTSFVITSASAVDTSSISWLIVEPA